MLCIANKCLFSIYTFHAVDRLHTCFQFLYVALLLYSRDQRIHNTCLVSTCCYFSDDVITKLYWNVPPNESTQCARKSVSRMQQQLCHMWCQSGIMTCYFSIKKLKNTPSFTDYFYYIIPMSIFIFKGVSTQLQPVPHTTEFIAWASL